MVPEGLRITFWAWVGVVLGFELGFTVSAESFTAKPLIYLGK